ncbi:hypothetical protein ACHAW6_012647 [Cyclotella cf. meneghiniana]
MDKSKLITFGISKSLINYAALVFNNHKLTSAYSSMMTSLSLSIRMMLKEAGLNIEYQGHPADYA